jgi:3-hydroxymyristoyl/3-hydroxydecanoyl-(acyl carrier protein) dehydratase
MAHCLYQRGIRAFTGRIEVRFRQPVAIGTRLEIYAQLVQERGAFAIAKAWAAAADGELVAEAKSTLIRQPDEPSRSTET